MLTDFGGLPAELRQELASIVDDLGSLSLTPQRTRYGTYSYEIYRLSASDDILTKFHSVFGGGIYQNGAESGQIWKVSGKECRSMLHILYPLLKRRRELVRALIDYRRASALDLGESSRILLMEEATARFERETVQLKSDRRTF